MSASPSLPRIGWKWLKQTSALCPPHIKSLLDKEPRVHAAPTVTTAKRYVLKDRMNICLMWWAASLKVIGFAFSDGNPVEVPPFLWHLYLSDYGWQATLSAFSPNNAAPVLFFHLFSHFPVSAHQTWICHRFHNLGVKLVLGEYLIIAAAALARVCTRGDASCCQRPLNLQLMNFLSIIQLGPNLINNRQLADIVRRSSVPIMCRRSESV